MPSNSPIYSLSERDKAAVWHPFTPIKTAGPPIALVKGEGAYLIDEEGNRYLDAIASWWVNVHGHAHPYLAKKIYEQALELEHTIFAGFTHKPAVELAEKLLHFFDGHFSKVFFSDNGSTSVEVAIKMALQYFQNTNQKRSKILALNNAYHGDTFGSMSVGGRNVFSEAFSDLLFDVHFVEPTIENNEQFFNKLEQNLKTNQYAAFIFEPLVQGASGMLMYEANWLSKLIMLCQTYGVICIADEVFTGFYRTGKQFASNYLSEKPDIICLSKSLTGGMMALGATLATPKIFEAFVSNNKHHTFFHGHSFTANPIACSAANASLDLMADSDFENRVLMIIQRFEKEKLKFAQHEALIETRVLGCILALEIKTTGVTGYLNGLSEKATDFFLKKGIYLRPLGNVLYVTPPYIISENELDTIFNAIDEFLIQHLEFLKTGL